MGAKRQEWVKGRSEAHCGGRRTGMSQEEQAGREGISQELRLKRVNRQQSSPIYGSRKNWDCAGFACAVCSRPHMKPSGLA
jgi:hypothetical protein